LIVTTPALSDGISGTIVYDETIRQQKKDGTLFVKTLTDGGIVSGIKVDTGETHVAWHPGEQITEGLDGLRDRLSAYETQTTSRPQTAAPPLRCPSCSKHLHYLETTYGGIAPAARWDRYRCRTCGSFLEYRHRTGKLKYLNRTPK
jgi:hypothetical protein